MRTCDGWCLISYPVGAHRYRHMQHTHTADTYMRLWNWGWPGEGTHIEWHHALRLLISGGHSIIRTHKLEPTESLSRAQMQALLGSPSRGFRIEDPRICDAYKLGRVNSSILIGANVGAGAEEY